MGKWLDHTVISEIHAPVELVWKFWSDLDSMPLWMTWIESVKTVDEKTSTLPDLTESGHLQLMAFVLNGKLKSQKE